MQAYTYRKSGEAGELFAGIKNNQAKGKGGRGKGDKVEKVSGNESALSSKEPPQDKYDYRKHPRLVP